MGIRAVRNSRSGETLPPQCLGADAGPWRNSYRSVQFNFTSPHTSCVRRHLLWKYIRAWYNRDTNKELTGILEVEIRDARNASQWFPPIFPMEFRILGAQARRVFSPRRRFEIPCDTKLIFACPTKRIFAILDMQPAGFFFFVLKKPSWTVGFIQLVAPRRLFEFYQFNFYILCKIYLRKNSFCMLASPLMSRTSRF